MRNNPKIIVRMGSHAEKEYIIKLGSALDGIIVGANVVEATAGATASLLGKKLSTTPYYIDPMTYVFGLNLDGIKSDQKKGRDYKRSYRNLASKLGPLFVEALQKNRAIATENLSSSSIQTICQDVVNYQIERIQSEFENDEDYKDYANDIPSPAAIIAPYFFIRNEDDFNLFLRMSSVTANMKEEVKVHAVLCVGVDALEEKSSFVDLAVRKIPGTGVSGVWLWFSEFDEWEEKREGVLRNFVKLVNGLSQQGIEVYNRHGGFFSLLLNKFGMNGVSHGIGYGEKKDVLQIEGPPNAPIVNYYVPSLFRRLGVDVVDRCMSNLEIETIKDFHSSICGCIICRGVIKEGLSDIWKFGETHFANSNSKRQSQTPAAAKRCRYHFMMNRIAEKKYIAKNDLSGIIEDMRQAKEKWSNCATITQCKHAHLDRWINVLESMTS